MRKSTEGRRPSTLAVVAAVALLIGLAAPALAGPADSALRNAKRALGLAKKADKRAKKALDATDKAFDRAVVRFRDEPLAVNDHKVVRADCHQKERAISGGYSLTGFTGTDVERVAIFHNGPEGPPDTVEGGIAAGDEAMSWAVGAVNRTAGNSGGIRVWAICAR